MIDISIVKEQGKKYENSERKRFVTLFERMSREARIWRGYSDDTTA